MNLTTNQLKNYELIDSGLGKKLEIISGIKVIRPSPQAIWRPQKPDSLWKEATSECVRTKEGGGKWIHHKAEPPELTLPFDILPKAPGESRLEFRLKFTSFGHCGVFFEQVPIWLWLYEQTTLLKQKLGRPPKIVNLFGYTGCASLVMALAGAQVFHVDSAKGVLEWGKESQALSKIPNGQITWVQEDAMAFLRHSFKKKFLYDGCLADPPSWGHGAKKEVWDFEKSIHLLIELILATLSKEKSFLLLSGHTHGVQSEALKNIIHDPRWRSVQCGELGVKHRDDERILPAGIYVAAQS